MVRFYITLWYSEAQVRTWHSFVYNCSMILQWLWDEVQILWRDSSQSSSTNLSSTIHSLHTCWLNHEKSNQKAPLLKANHDVPHPEMSSCVPTFGALYINPFPSGIYLLCSTWDHTPVAQNPWRFGSRTSYPISKSEDVSIPNIKWHSICILYILILLYTWNHHIIKCEC
jgi:hypothetical protein